MNLEFESLIQISPNPSGLSCISPIHSFCHVSCMHHIVAYCLVMFVYRCSLRQVLPLRSIETTPTKNNISAPTHQASNQPFDHIDTIPCSRFCSLYCIKTTRFKLLCATVVEPISSAWPVIATVTRWNPLACVGVDWAICMCCSYPAMSAMLRVVSGLVHLGDGLEWNDYVGNESGVVNTIW